MIIMVVSCNKQDPVSITRTPQEQWILDSMRFYYYWSETIPASPTSQPAADSFFRSLLYAGDRFSYLEDPGIVKTAYSSFAYYGFEYELIGIPVLPGRLLGVITLSVPGSSSFARGLQRGDYFTAVNNVPLTAANREQIIRILKQGNGVRLERATISNAATVVCDTLTIPVAHFREQPVYQTHLFGNNAKKTGYLFYNYFDGSFDSRLMDSIYKLKTAGITELIIDMRYNPGGDVSSAAKLSAVLAPVQAGQTFVIYQANRNGGRSSSSFAETIHENNYQPTDFTAILQYRLALSRVIVLTGASTASAAELLINNLKPYMNVIQIGQKTLGKDMASFAINDQRTPKQVPYVLHPLIFKLYNAHETGDYATGLSPDVFVDEMSYQPLQPIGSINDPLIRQALEITGTPLSVIGRQAYTASEHIYSSAKARSELQLPLTRKYFRQR